MQDLQTEMLHSERGSVMALDSAADVLPRNQGRNVLVTAGHTGRSGARHILKVMPFGFVCSDCGRGRNDSGMAGLEITAAEGIAGATVDAHLARMGDGMSTYEDGVISAVNTLAAGCGARVGMTAREAALLLVGRGSKHVQSIDAPAKTIHSSHLP